MDYHSNSYNFPPLVRQTPSNKGEGEVIIPKLAKSGPFALENFPQNTTKFLAAESNKGGGSYMGGVKGIGVMGDLKSKYKQKISFLE